MPRQTSPYTLLYPSANGTIGFVLSGSPAFYNSTTLATATRTDTPNTPYIKLGDDSPNNGVAPRARGIRLMFLGLGVNGATIAYDLYLVKKLVHPIKPTAYDAVTPNYYMLNRFCSGEAALNSSISTGPLFSSSSVYYADTISMTLSAYGTAMESASDSPGTLVYLPAADSVSMPAELIIPDVYGADGVILDLYGGTGTAATEFNAYYSITDG